MLTYGGKPDVVAEGGEGGALAGGQAAAPTDYLGVSLLLKTCVRSAESTRWKVRHLGGRAGDVGGEGDGAEALHDVRVHLLTR